MIKGLCVAFFFMVTDFAVCANWNGIGGDYNGDYTNQLMWSTGTVPSDFESVYFTKPGAYTVAVNSACTNGYTEFNGSGNPYNMTVAFGAGAKLSVRTNLVVRGGTVANPARVILSGGTADVFFSGNGSGGLNDKNAELYLTNTFLNVPTAYFYVGIGSSNNVFSVGSGSCYTGAQIVVGDQTASWFNRMEVSGPGALVAIPNYQIRLGINGCRNSLVVTNGGQVRVNSLALGTVAGASNMLLCVNGEVTVSGANGNLHIGAKGSYNTAVFGAGGRLTTRATGNVYVGGDGGGSYNRLSFTDGAVATNSSTFYIGYLPTNMNNRVELYGPDTTFVNTNNTLYVGASGQTNLLVVADGARFLSSKGDLVCGQNATAAGNRIMVSDSEVVVSNAFYAGQNGSYNTVTVTNSPFVVAGSFTVGANTATGNLFIAVGGSAVASASPLIVANTSSCCENEVRFDDAEGLFGNNGAAFGNNPSSIGASGHANRLLIRGAAGRVVITNAALYVGYWGSRNQLAIENGGRLRCRGLLIGDQTGVSNSAAITGSGSRIDSADADIRVGAGSSTGSVFVVSDGAVVDSGNSGFGVNYATTTFGSSLLVSNAVVLCTNNNFWAKNDAVITLAGTGSVIDVKNCQLYNSATLAVAIPRAGRQNTNALIQVRESLTLGSPVLRISAQEWALRTGGRITLLTYGGSLSGDLAGLASSAQLDSPELSVSVVGKSLVLSAPSRKGTLMRIH